MDAFVELLIIYAETTEPVSQNFYQGLCEKAAERIEQLEAALKVIAKPKLKECVFTSKKAEDEYHKEQMQQWLDVHYSTENHRILILTYYQGATCIAEQALKGAD